MRIVFNIPERKKLYIINLHITLKQFKYQKRNLYQLYLEDISILLIFHLDISFEYWEKFTLFMHTNYTIYAHTLAHFTVQYRRQVLDSCIRISFGGKMPRHENLPAKLLKVFSNANILYIFVTH